MGTPYSEVNPIRLTKYRNYGDDGRSYVEYGHQQKDKVFVALIVGEEPKKLTCEEDLLDIESVILAMADHIRAQKKPAKKKKKAVAKKKTPKKKAVPKKAAKKKT